MRVNSSVVLIPLFGVDVPASSEGVRFGTELTRTETDSEVELMKVFRPAGLAAGKKFGGSKVLEILVVGDQSDRAELIIRTLDRENTSDGIIGGISLNDNGHIRHPVRKHRSSGEGGLESGESSPTIVGEVPRGIFASKTSEGNHDVGVVINEPPIEIGEAQEGLNVLHLARLRPVTDRLDFVG